MMKTVNICINGAGPVGATLACVLARAGLRVLIIERSPLEAAIGPHLDGRAYALSEGSRRVLAQSGVWSHLPNGAQPIKEISVIDGRDVTGPRPNVARILTRIGTRSLIFGAQDLPDNEAELQGFGWMVEAMDLRRALHDALRHHAGPNLIIAAPDQARFTFDDDGAIIALTSGAQYRAQLVVAAEGRQSPLRKQAGIPLTRLAYQQNGIVTIIAHENAHDGTALERFLPDGPFARLPLISTDAAPHRSAIVWAAPAARAHYLHALPDETFKREINARLDKHVGAATPVGRRWLYPLSAQYAQKYVSHRLALIGDAAHGLHPIAGQGLNMGFRDIKILSEVLVNAFEKGQDPGRDDVLKLYQRLTRPDNMAMLLTCDIMERVFASRHPAMQILRRVGMRGFEKATPLRARFIRRTMGLL
ncbi:UbiH/UbiF/VisC/COQ6 family ubiquinone biosynthesis hydroxylase [Candidatus Kirkpatrickella diaphorinae]|uniref:UbiH/UbiF/VisC/COQ6 family ubiquinone biosynthesis hydroxylase n=1 Tax=Candidatus Kirkpatrickella diaphorinae TaxID=2984322 RepID=A0ABY6GJE9_9PROT|nr:UbiH/UbiF/VisC/COQ6 family ubiquinone biosynthesis hydroxylase [Candidatus Kirkpatrickella diaphorinae]UYH50965.1 UbiH/UbiF/VisC/COQ6 family ubiquinone biosynthesis hydroxylase [Candidatus Kirkpatrickella diaphorinae]